MKEARSVKSTWGIELVRKQPMHWSALQATQSFLCNKKREENCVSGQTCHGVFALRVGSVDPISPIDIGDTPLTWAAVAVDGGHTFTIGSKITRKILDFYKETSGEVSTNTRYFDNSFFPQKSMQYRLQRLRNELERCFAFYFALTVTKDCERKR